MFNDDKINTYSWIPNKGYKLSENFLQSKFNGHQLSIEERENFTEIFYP